MKVTIELPPIEDENAEEIISQEFGQLISVCKSVLADYKRKGINVPRISISLPKKEGDKTAEKRRELSRFMQELLDFHMKRVPTANAAGQMKTLKELYENGYTDKQFLIDTYNSLLKTKPMTSWFTVKWQLNTVKTDTPEPAGDLEFHRRQLSDEDKAKLIERLKIPSQEND
jgi:hypothetical protein